MAKEKEEISYELMRTQEVIKEDSVEKGLLRDMVENKKRELEEMEANHKQRIDQLLQSCKVQNDE